MANLKSLLLVPALFVASTGIATASTLENCLRAASDIKSGSFLKVEYLNPSAEGMPVYEIELRANDGREWEFMCNANDGSIIEIEQEVDSPKDTLFAQQAKFSTKEAIKAATTLYPGEVEEIEYEIESNGDASYEIDILDKDGTEFKVEVDAASGKVIEVHVEQWEIGEEADERS